MTDMQKCTSETTCAECGKPLRRGVKHADYNIHTGKLVVNWRHSRCEAQYDYRRRAAYILACAEDAVSTAKRCVEVATEVWSGKRRVSPDAMYRAYHVAKNVDSGMLQVMELLGKGGAK